MSIYKDASKLALRFPTEVGNLSVEQLWNLSNENLDKLAIKLQAEYKASGKKSFLVAKSAKDRILKLKFDIVLDVLTTKVEEAEKASNAAEVRAHNQRITDLIAKKKDGELEDMSIEDLEKQYK